MRPDRLRIFLWGSVGTFSITSLYLISLFIIVPINYFAYYFKIEVTWSIYSWLFVPLGIGVISIEAYEIFCRASHQWRPVWGGGLLAFFLLIGWGAWSDSNRIPSAQNIATVGGLSIGKYAMDVDRCLRDVDDCADPNIDRQKLINNVDSCRQKYGGLLKKLLGSKDKTSRDPYVCALINYIFDNNGVISTKNMKITQNILGSISILLNWIIFDFVILFIFCLCYQSFGGMFKLGLETLSDLIVAWSILVIWFPVRLYADWSIWYQDLNHLVTGNPPFVISLVFAFITFVIIAADFVVSVGKYDAVKTISTIYGGIVTIFGIAVAARPDKFTIVFKTISELPIDLVIISVLLFLAMVCGQVYVLVLRPKDGPAIAVAPPAAAGLARPGPDETT